MDIWIIFTFWLLRIVLLGTFMYKSLCGHVFISSCKETWVEFLGYVVNFCLTFKKLPEWLYHITFHCQCMRNLFFLILAILIIPFLVGVKWCHCGFNMNKISCAIDHSCVFWWNVYSDCFLLIWKTWIVFLLICKSCFSAGSSRGYAKS